MEKKLKLLPILLVGCVVFCCSGCIEQLTNPGTGDITRNNVFAPRSENWFLVDDAPPLIQVDKNGYTSRNDFSFIDGSTATVPLTAEIIRQQEALCSPIETIFKTKGEEDSYDRSVNDYVDRYLHAKTHESYEHLIDGECKHDVDGFSNDYFRHTNRKTSVDLVFATRPSEEELIYAENNGVTLDIEELCNEAFVFIVNKSNPVDSLTISQIQDIYQGQITNWNQVGGNDQEITAFQRNANSGSQTAMEQLVMRGKPMIKPDLVQERVYIGMMQSLIEEVAKEYDDGPGSIGYTYNFYINAIYKHENIKVLKIEGVEPNAETIKDKTYQLYTSYYGVIRKDDEDSDPRAKILRDYLLTPSGQQYIELAGYFPL